MSAPYQNSNLAMVLQFLTRWFRYAVFLFAQADHAKRPIVARLEIIPHTFPPMLCTRMHLLESPWISAHSSFVQGDARCYIALAAD